MSWKSSLPNSLSLTSAKDKQVLAPVLSGDRWTGLFNLWTMTRVVQYRLTKKGWNRWSVDEKESKRTLAAVLCFVLGLLLAIASIQVQSRAIPRRVNTDSFPAKDYKIWVSKTKEIKQFKWTIRLWQFEEKVRLQAESATRNPWKQLLWQMGRSRKKLSIKTAQR